MGNSGRKTSPRVYWEEINLFRLTSQKKQLDVSLKSVIFYYFSYIFLIPLRGIHSVFKILTELFPNHESKIKAALQCFKCYSKTRKKNKNRVVGPGLFLLLLKTQILLFLEETLLWWCLSTDQDSLPCRASFVGAQQPLQTHKITKII